MDSLALRGNHSISRETRAIFPPPYVRSVDKRDPLLKREEINIFTKL